jgi:hypothetical protein
LFFEKKNYNKNGLLKQSIFRLLEGFQEVRINHVFREANRCANMLANIGCDSLDIVFFEHPPSEVIQILDDDFKGVSFLRLFSM